MSVLLAMAAGETSRFTSANATVVNLEKPEGSSFMPCIGLSVPENLNAAATAFLHSTHEWLFLLNDDQVYGPTTLMRLIAHDRPVVTGLTTGRMFPFVPAIYGPQRADGSMAPIFLRSGMQGLLPVHYCGDHSLLIRRDVLKAMRRPWWAHNSDRWPGRERVQHDVVFCDGVREAGFDIVCDLDTPVGHLAVMPIVPQRDANGNWSTGVRMSNDHWVHFSPAARVDKQAVA